MNENENENVNRVDIEDSHINPQMTFRRLCYLHMQQLTNFPYIEKDFDALTDYELLCLIVKYLNDVIKNSNKQNESIMNLYNAFMGLQTYINEQVQFLEDSWNGKVEELESEWSRYTTEIETAFNNLQDWIDNYFNNLDVQEEIDNKLDQMLEDGVLEQIIEQFIQSTALWCFDTVEDMKDATNLINGSYAKTLGYHSLNDGGGAVYKITDTESLSSYQEELDSGLYATLINNKEINIKKLGSYGDGTHDETSILSYAINNYKTIVIPSGTYLVNQSITINNGVTIKGENKSSSIIKINDDIDGLLLNSSYINIENLTFNNITDYSKSIIRMLTPSNVVGQMIKNCVFVGVSNTGNAIEFNATDFHGLMQCIIEKCTFNKFYNCIYFNLLDGWNSGTRIKDCWEWGCVYGINYSNNSAGTSNMYVSNFKAQWTSGVTQTLINNLKGPSNTIDNCFIWDGGMTLDISTSALYTIVRNITIVDKFKFNDSGYRTRVENISINTSHGRYYEYRDDFINNSIDEYNIVKSSGASVTKQMVAPTSGEARPGILLQTGTTTNDYASFNLGKTLLIDSAQWDLEFDLYCPDLSNVEFYCGGAIVLSANPQGNFIGYNTSIDTDSTYLKAIDRGDQGFISSTNLMNNPATNKWLHCQIKYLSQTRCLFFINEQLLGEIDSHRYNQCPYFFIKTLDGTNKSLGIANIYLKTYIY